MRRGKSATRKPVTRKDKSWQEFENYIRDSIYRSIVLSASQTLLTKLSLPDPLRDFLQVVNFDVEMNDIRSAMEERRMG